MTDVVAPSSVRWVDPIAERVQWLVEHRAEGNARALARKAGLSSETHVGLILERGAARTAGTVLAKIAEAGGVRLDWLIKGEGPRDLHPKTAARVRSTSFASNRDLSVLEWTKHILAEDERVRFEDEHPMEHARDVTRAEDVAGASDPKLRPMPAKWPGGRRPKAT